MIKYGITGNIACGKSVAFQIIKESGLPIIDCDDIVKELYTDDLCAAKIKKEFPQIIENNKINLKILSNLLFNDINFKKKYEAFIFPKVKEKIKEFYELKNKEEKTFVIAPLLFEAGFEDLFDKIIFISAEKEIRKERLIKRNSILSLMAERVINAQFSEEEKNKMCDYVIKNNGTLEEFKNAVINMLNII